MCNEIRPFVLPIASNSTRPTSKYPRSLRFLPMALSVRVNSTACKQPQQSVLSTLQHVSSNFLSSARLSDCATLLLGRDSGHVVPQELVFLEC